VCRNRRVPKISLYRRAKRWKKNIVIFEVDNPSAPIGWLDGIVGDADSIFVDKKEEYAYISIGV